LAGSLFHKPLQETLRFSLEGADYEIDLSAGTQPNCARRWRRSSPKAGASAEPQAAGAPGLYQPAGM